MARRLLNIKPEQLRKLYIDDDLSIRQIARQLGVVYRSIQLRLQILGLKKNPQTIEATRKRNIRDTMILKYGSDHYMKSKIGYEQYRDKLQQHFGVTNIMRLASTSKEHCVCSTQIKLQQRGVTNIMQLASTKEHRASTCLIKYGVDHDLKSPIIREKMKQTLLKRYGVDNPFKSKKLMAKSLSRRRIINGYWGKGQHIDTKFGTIFIRSSYEKKFLEILLKTEGVKTLIYEPFVIPVNGSEYIPDFLINNCIIIEVKPKRFIFPPPTDNNFVKKIAARNLIKHQALTEWANKNNFTYFLVTETEINQEWCNQWLI